MNDGEQIFFWLGLVSFAMQPGYLDMKTHQSSGDLAKFGDNTQKSPQKLAVNLNYLIVAEN